jgi:hypothetical protein
VHNWNSTGTPLGWGEGKMAVGFVGSGNLLMLVIKAMKKLTRKQKLVATQG